MFKTILTLIGPKRRNQMLALIPLMLLASLLEIAGLSMVVSVCAALADSTWMGENPAMAWLRAALHINSEAVLTTVILLALIALYAFKLPYLAWENYMVAKFVRTTRHEMSARLCQRIVHSPYPFFTRHSTAELENLLGQDTFQFSTGINAYMQILMEALVVLGMGICLLLIDPAMTLFLTAGIISLMVLIRVILIRPIRSASQRQRDANRRRWKWLHHIVGGIKDIKTGHQEDYFAEHFADASTECARSDYLRQFWIKLPTLCIESVMVLTVLLYILFFVRTGKQLLDYLPRLSALAWTAIRLLPACSRINASLTEINYAKPSVKAICRVMEETAGQADTVRALQTDVAISEGIALRRVSYCYEGRPEPVLRDVDMEIAAGTSVGIIGPSGAGKTTLLDVLLGLLTPERGEVMVDGIPIGQCAASYLQKVAYVPQDTFLLDDTVRSNVALGEEPDEADDSRVWAALEQADLAQMIRGLPDGLDTYVGERGVRLSGGERQRLSLARAMYQDPALIVFDEATSSLDLETEAAVLRSIFRLQGKKTLIIVSHRMTAIEYCNVVYRVQDGTVRQEKPEPRS
jgi:hypothetical protein